jgi:hypothetical protein
MEEELDSQVSSEPEVELDTTPVEPETELTVDDYNKARELANNQKIRAEKAEKELKELKSKQTLEKPTPKNDEPKSDEPDYAKLAFLKSEGITHADDQKIVQDEAKRLKLPLTEVLQMEHIKGKLKDAKDQREAQDGSPKGKGKSGGSNSTDVDYWLAKGETPTNDLELAEKVINARMKKESSAGMFSDELWT